MRTVLGVVHSEASYELLSELFYYNLALMGEMRY
jgi:hypothetical protein